MEYQLALAPDIALSAADFAATWNADDSCTAVAQATTRAPRGSQFEPVTLTAIAVLSTIGVEMTAHALYDLVKHTLRRRAVKERLSITELTQPDGTHLLVVTSEKG